MSTINTQADYAAYEARVQAFWIREAIHHLSTGKPDVEPWFSWRKCECCGNTNGGMRETLRALDSHGPVEYDICEDCVYYTNYGRLDDATMLRIESENKA